MAIDAGPEGRVEEEAYKKESTSDETEAFVMSFLDSIN